MLQLYLSLFPSLPLFPSGSGVFCLYRKSPRRRSAFDHSDEVTPAKKARLEVSPLDWTDRFTGLWKTQEADFATEQAFNQLMSLNRSQCCVCSLFESPSPFSNYKPASLRLALQTRTESASKGPSIESLKVMCIGLQLVHPRMCVYTCVHVLSLNK